MAAKTKAKKPVQKTKKPAAKPSKTKKVLKQAAKAKPAAKAKTKAKKVHKKAAKATPKKVEKKAAGKSQKSTASVAQVTRSQRSENWQNFLTPLDDRLIVEVAAAERMTAGGLYIPDSVRDVSGNWKGQVLTVGRGRRDKFGKIHPMDVKAGDQIVYSQMAGSKMNLNGKEVMILRESDVLGIVE